MADQAKVDELQHILADMKMSTIMPCYQSGSKEEILNVAEPRMEMLTKYLGHKNFLMGDYISYLDFYMYEMLDCLDYTVDGKILEKFPIWKDY